MAEWSFAAVLKTVELRGSGGFESLSLRNKGCKLSNYKIYTLFYTQKLKQNAFAMQFYLKVLLF